MRRLIIGILDMVQKDTIFITPMLVLTISSKHLVKSYLSIKFILLPYITRECSEMFKNIRYYSNKFDRKNYILVTFPSHLACLKFEKIPYSLQTVAKGIKLQF